MPKIHDTGIKLGFYATTLSNLLRFLKDNIYDNIKKYQIPQNKSIKRCLRVVGGKL